MRTDETTDCRLAATDTEQDHTGTGSAKAFPLIGLSADFPRGHQTAGREQHVRLTIDETLAVRIRDADGRIGVEPRTTLLAAVGILLARHTQQAAV